ncbi:MAG TPA: hypothetical protein VHB21_14890 [Minicystis sp.]|nr:hypothetical protein [Minicystis sp.]
MLPPRITRFAPTLLFASLPLFALPACAAFDGPAGPDGGTGSGAGGSTTSGGGGASGLPCDVASVLESHCLSCHGDPPSGGAPEPLNSYAALTAPSTVDPSQTYAERAVVRMQDTAAPMPPAPASPVTAADIATFQSWIDAGMPQGSCGNAGGNDPLNAKPGCVTGRNWYGEEGGGMDPGRACIACHAQGGGDEGGPIFAFAGTVYSRGHESDDCIAAPEVQNAEVDIIDANGNVALRLYPNSSGNFYSPYQVKLPYTAKVVYQGRERAMMTPQNTGDCNTCHTQSGSQNAPGRITLP